MIILQMSFGLLLTLCLVCKTVGAPIRWARRPLWVPGIPKNIGQPGTHKG